MPSYRAASLLSVLVVACGSDPERPLDAGVAPDADLIAIQVFSRIDDSAIYKPCQDGGSRSPCLLTETSDYILGLQRIFGLRSRYRIASVNMSLGGGAYLNCDTIEAATKAQIDLLRVVGISTVISSGNSGYRTAQSAPGCISTAISVGATTTNNPVDTVASFSNIAPNTTLLAPGTPINAAVPRSATTGT